jgi:copper oxidase (laccase) domain-containing protein
VSFDTVGSPGSDTPLDTSNPAWFSHRTRGDTGRQVTVAWREPT